MNTSRTRYDVIFTAPRIMIKPVMEELGKLMAVSYGGVTFLNSEDGATGFWADNGNETVAQYSSHIHIESTIYMQLTVLPEYQEQALADIQSAIKSVCTKYKTGTNHVHIDRSIVQALHFNLDQI